MRDDEQYFHEAVAALFHGMTEHERQEIVFMPFIAHTEPRLHYAYQEPWLEHLADNNVEYNKSSPEYPHICDAERNKNSWEKGLIDYRLILEACYDSGASYNLIIEDDVLALYGWFSKTKGALQSLDPETPFLYLRLFYSEIFLGWQSQNWLVYLTWSVGITTVVVLLLFAIWFTVSILRKTTTIYQLLVYSIINCAFMIGLCFAAGRLTIFPLNHGVIEMEDGCCAQSLVFPREVVPALVDRLRGVQDGHADQRLDQIADQMNLKRLALVPSVFQHIGSRTSHEADLPEDVKFGMSLAGQVFNIKFEQNDAVTLRREHMEKATISHIADDRKTNARLT